MDLTSTFASSFVCHSAAGRAGLDAENAYKLQYVCWDRVINGTAHIINNNYYFFFVRVCEFGVFANDGEFAARQSIRTRSVQTYNKRNVQLKPSISLSLRTQ